MKKNGDRKYTFLYSLAKLLAWPLMLLFFPTLCKNRKKLNIEAPYIIVSNHKSLLDVVLIALYTRREIHFLGKHTLRKNPIMRFLLDRLHLIPVERNNSDMKAMRRCVKVLEEGKVLGIFPEGTRRRNGDMQELLSGAAIIALRSKVPIVPVLIAEKPRLFRLTRMYVGDPIVYDDLLEKGVDKENCDELLRRIRTNVLQLNEKREEFC